MYGYLEEVNLAEAKLVEDASPVAVGSKPDILRRHAAKIYGRIVLITRCTQGLGEFVSSTERHKIDSVSRVFNDYFFES